jgi:thiol-disulfide isomerase/thioredoxin
MLRTQLCSGLLVLCMAILVGSAPAAQAAERVVVAENFAATWCVYCPIAGQALSDLMDDYPEDFTFVQYHVDDAYDTSWGNSRANFYNVSGIPDTWFDGRLRVLGGVEYPTMYNRFQSQQNRPTDVSLQVWGEQVSGNTYNFTAEVGLDQGGTAKTVRVYMVQVLDVYPGPAQGEPKTYYRNCFMQAMSPLSVSLTPGETTEVSRQFTLSLGNGGLLTNAKVIAWAQVPASGAPAEIYQAAQTMYPFTPPTPPGDWDADGDVDLTDFSEVPDCLSGPGEYASRPCGDVFDLDFDFHVDLADVAKFMLEYTGSIR